MFHPGFDADARVSCADAAAASDIMVCFISPLRRLEAPTLVED